MLHRGICVPVIMSFLFFIESEKFELICRQLSGDSHYKNYGSTFFMHKVFYFLFYGACMMYLSGNVIRLIDGIC